MMQDACKIAKVMPLFKKDTRMDPKNYCPISLLLLTSKVLEIVIHEQTTEFFDKHNFFLSFNQVLGKTIQPIFVYLNNKISNSF